MFYPEQLKTIRENKKISQQKLGEAIGRTRLTILRWENKTRKPSESDIRQMAVFLKIKVEEISDLKEQQSKTNSLEDEIAEFDSMLEGQSEIPIEFKHKYMELKSLLNEQNSQLTMYRNEKSRQDFLIQNLPFIIYTKDAETFKYNYVNDAFLSLLPPGASLHTVQGSSALQYFGSQDYSDLLKAEQKAKLQRQRIKVTAPIPGTQGKRIGEAFIVPIIKDNIVIELSCTIKDITEEYEESKARLDMERAVNGLQQFIWIGYRDNPYDYTESLKFTYISQSCEKHFKIPKHELFSGEKNILDFIHPEDIQKIEEWYKKPYPKDIECRMIINDNTMIVTIQAFKEDNVFWGIINDISELRKTEKQRIELERAVNGLEPLIWIGYREEPDNYKDPIRYTYISDSCETYWGIDKNYLLKTPNAFEQFICESEYEKLYNWMQLDYPKNIDIKVNINGTEKYVHSKVYRSCNTFWGVIEDTTDYEAQKKELKAVLETFNSSTDAIKIAKIDKNGKKKHIFANNANKELYEIDSLRELRDNPDNWINYIHPDDRNRMKKIDKRFIGRKESSYKMLLPSGHLKYIEESQFRKQIDDFVFSGTIKRDVTGRYLKNIERKSIIRALDLTNDAIWIVQSDINGENGFYLFMNKARYELYGLTKEYIETHPYFYLDYIHPEDIQIIEEAAQRKEESAYKIYYRLIKDGEIIQISETIFSQNIGKKKISGGIQRIVGPRQVNK